MAATAHCPRAVRTVLFGVLAAVPAVHAADTLQTARSTAVTVTARRPLEERSIATATVVDMERFQDRKVTMAEVLAEQPGVQVRQLGGFGSYSTVSIRGASAENTRVYLDGVLLNQAIGGAVDLSTIPMDNIDQIEIYRGILPAGMAGSGMGGVVNIKTKSAAKGTNVTAKASGGSFGTYTLNAGASVRSRNHRLLVMAGTEGSTNDFEYWGENAGTGVEQYLTRRNAGYRTGDFQLKSMHRLPFGKLDAGVSGKMSRKGVPGNIESTPTEMARFDERLLVSSAGVDLACMPRFIQKCRLSVFNTYRYSNFLDTLTYDDGDVAKEAEAFIIKMDTDNRNVTTGVSAHVAAVPAAWMKNAVDVTYSYESFNYTNRLDAPEDLLPMQRHLGEFSVSSDVSTQDGRLAGTVSWNGSLVRASYMGLKHYELVTTLRNVDESYFGGSAGARYRVVPALTIRANAGRFYRIPSTFELFGNSGRYLGNTDLEPEYGLNADVGIMYRLSFLTATLGGFYSRYTNLIIELTNSQHIVYPDNVGEADNTGIEFDYAVRAPAWLELHGNATWQQPINRFGNYDGYYIPNKAQWEVYQHNGVRMKGWTLFHEYFFVGRNYRDVRNLKYWPARHLHTAGIMYRNARIRMTGTLEVRNLLQERSRDLMDVYGYPLPGRHILLTVRYGA